METKLDCETGGFQDIYDDKGIIAFRRALISARSLIKCLKTRLNEDPDDGNVICEINEVLYGREQEYLPRLELTQEEQELVKNAFLKITCLPFKKILEVIGIPLHENAVLLKEVNHHRQAMGFMELPSYAPEPNPIRKPYKHH